MIIWLRELGCFGYELRTVDSLDGLCCEGIGLYGYYLYYELPIENHEKEIQMETEKMEFLKKSLCIDFDDALNGVEYNKSFEKYVVAHPSGDGTYFCTDSPDEAGRLYREAFDRLFPWRLNLSGGYCVRNDFGKRAV